MKLRPAVLPLACLSLAIGLNAPAAAGDDPAAVQTFPPSADRQAAPGTGIWVLFALQPSGRPAAWELRLDGAEPALVQRCEFAPSSWAPDFLFARAPEPAPELVRFQCRASVPPPGYVVPLFHIDYRTWDVTPLVVSRQVHGLAAFPELAWLVTTDGVRVFERGTGTLRAAKQEFRPIRTWDDAWLVELPGGAQGARTAALFDPRTESMLSSTFPLPPAWDDEWHILLSPTRAHLAAIDLAFREDSSAESLGFQETRALNATLEIQAVGPDAVHRIPVRVSCCGGSGRRFIPVGLRVQFSADGHRLEMDGASADGEGAPAERLTIDPDAGTVLTKQPVETIDEKEGASPATPGSDVPEWLRDAWNGPAARASTEGGRRLAHAFLSTHGVSFVPVAVLSTRLAFTPDGGQFLLQMLDPQAPTDLLLGDLRTRELRRIPCPAELRVPDLNIGYVRVR